MARMIDMIRDSKVPSNLMQSAARGALSVAPDETIEILVYLALHSKMFGEQARLTLAGWDEKASLAVAGDPKTNAEVLAYFAAPENLRTCLIPALAGNQSIGEEKLSTLATVGTRSVAEALLASARVMSSVRLLQALQTNANLSANHQAEIRKKIAVLESKSAEGDAVDAADDVIESTVVKFLEENAAEIEAEKDKPFQPIGISLEEINAEADTVPEDAAGVAADKEAVKSAAAAATAKAKKAQGLEERRNSPLQKIGKLDIKGRITLAMRGSKEERGILIRDSTKLVALAVLDSPKVSDGEVEKFALQKNVLEAVLRAIPMRRKFAKNYNITRNLVQNPRTPLDLSLGLMKNLLVHDLKNLSGNKEVSDTIRKMALRMFKQKVEKKG
jgi:hypothetical protein